MSPSCLLLKIDLWGFFQGNVEVHRLFRNPNDVACLLIAAGFYFQHFIFGFPALPVGRKIKILVFGAAVAYRFIPNVGPICTFII